MTLVDRKESDIIIFVSAGDGHSARCLDSPSRYGAKK